MSYILIEILLKFVPWGPIWLSIGDNHVKGSRLWEIEEGTAAPLSISE